MNAIPKRERPNCSAIVQHGKYMNSQGAYLGLSFLTTVYLLVIY